MRIPFAYIFVMVIINADDMIILQQNTQIRMMIYRMIQNIVIERSLYVI